MLIYKNVILKRLSIHFDKFMY